MPIHNAYFDSCSVGELRDSCIFSYKPFHIASSSMAMRVIVYVCIRTWRRDDWCVCTVNHYCVWSFMVYDKYNFYFFTIEQIKKLFLSEFIR